MTDLSTEYLGLKLANPIIAGSSGFTKSADAVRECADAGAGAVVLKSIFEEQIAAEVDELADASGESMWHPEAAEYIGAYGRENAVDSYLRTIREAKRAVSIPIVASVHCVSAGGWTDFSRRLEQAGADALELNAFVMPSDPRRTGQQNEQVYLDLLKAVKERVSIPVSLKLGTHFSSLATSLARLDAAGADGLVLFNRFYCPDFDIERMQLVPAAIHSRPGDHVESLRWISILSGRLECELAASTGVHDGAVAIKQILAGAKAVQVCSALYKKGLETIGRIREQMRAWMKEHGMRSLADFRGRLAQSASDNPAAYDRVQFMKTSVGIE